MDKKTIKETIKRHKDLLKKYKVKSLFLFGSYVRGEQRKDSDIDLLVDFKEPSYSNYINLVFSLEKLLNKEVCLVTPHSLSPHIKPFVLKEAEKIEG